MSILLKKLSVLVAGLVGISAFVDSAEAREYTDRCPRIFNLPKIEALKVLKWSINCNLLSHKALESGIFFLKRAESSDLSNPNFNFAFPYWVNESGSVWDGPLQQELRDQMAALNCKLTPPIGYSNDLFCTSGQ